MDFSEMQSAVFTDIDELSAGASDFASVQDVKDALNEAQAEMADHAEYHEISFTLTRQANAIYYDLLTPGSGGVPAGLATTPILAVKRVFNVQTNRWLDMIHVRDLDEYWAPAWENAVGETGYWFLRGLWMMGIFPKYGSTSGTLTVYGVACPPDLAASGDTPAFPKEHHQGLVDHAVYSLMCEDAEFKKGASRYYARYNRQSRELEGGYLYHAEAVRRWANERVSLDRRGTLGGAEGWVV